MEDELEKHFEKVYTAQLEHDLDKIFKALEERGLISEINILYWSPEYQKFQIIKLNPYE